MYKRTLRLDVTAATGTEVCSTVTPPGCRVLLQPSDACLLAPFPMHHVVPFTSRLLRRNDPHYKKACRCCPCSLKAHPAGGAAGAKPRQLTFEIFFPRPGDTGTPYRGAHYRAARGKVRRSGRGSAGTRHLDSRQISATCARLGTMASRACRPATCRPRFPPACVIS